MRSFAVIALLSGCGVGWIDGASGSDGLPTAGNGPYKRPVADDTTPALEPWLLIDPAADLTGPSALGRGDTGLRIWFARTAPDGLPSIWSAEIPNVIAQPDVAPRQVLVADQAWEQGAVAAPTVSRDPASGGLVMYYQGGVDAPAIGRAISDDDGATWTKDAAPVLRDARSPAAVVTDDDGWIVIAERSDGPAGLWRATGTPLAWDAAPVVTARPALAETFDATAVGDPVLVARVQPTGVASYGLWFTGVTVDPEVDPPVIEPAIGYAGSFDGASFTRDPSPDPVLVKSATSPSVVLSDDHAVMVFADLYRGRQAIGVGLH